MGCDCQLFIKENDDDDDDDSSESTNKVGIKCPSFRTSVRPSTKSFFDFNEICRIRIEADE